MNTVAIDVDALKHNLKTVQGWIRRRGGSLTVVTKALCGNAQALRTLQTLGVHSVGDSRISNIAALDRSADGPEVWYLRPVHMSAVRDVVAYSDVSLNSEIATIREIDREAGRQGRRHNIVVMVELGDLREGVLPVELVEFYRKATSFPNVSVIGLGANLGCLSGVVPTIDQLADLALYHELLELKFGRKLPILSGGTSAGLSLLLEGRMPERINHFRVGESILLGTDVVRGGTLDGLRNDVAVLEAEVIEVREKSLCPMGERGDLAPFHGDSYASYELGRRGYRALVTVGHVDTDIDGMVPVDSRHRIAGASSDITVVNIEGDNPGLRVGNIIRFRLTYSSFVRLMNNPYTRKALRGNVPARTVKATSEPDLPIGTCPTLIASAHRLPLPNPLFLH